jgi:hypothetical protein
VARAIARNPGFKKKGRKKNNEKKRKQQCSMRVEQ